MKLGDIKGERGIKTEKHSSDASAGKGSKIKGSVTQKMNESESVKITEKQHHTIKMTNAAKAAKDSTNEKTKALNPYLKIKGQKKE